MRLRDIRLSTTSAANHTPSENWVSIGNLEIRYLDWGGYGTPVLALHGLASSANWYDLIAPHLREYHRVIAPDQRGHGQTTQATSGYDGDTLSRDILGLMDHLDIPKVAVFGHSWGAGVALNVAARFPERIVALGLIDGGLSRGDGPARTWDEVKATVKPRDVTGTREEFLNRLRTQLAFCWNNDVERIVQTMVYEDDQGLIQDILRPENHIQVMQAMFEEPTSDWYPKVACPTVIIPAGPTSERATSERARIKQERVEVALQSIRNCRVKWIPETVHDIGYHKPRELAQVIRAFLAESSNAT